MEIVIDDVSPQIEYVNPGTSPQGKHGFWDNGYRSADDTEAVNMYKGTFYRSTGQENRVVLPFNASSILVFGSKWENHGPYTARIDAGQEVEGDGWSADRQLHQQLASFDNLALGQEHILTLTNYPDRNKRPEPAAADGWIDVDYILLRHEVEGQIHMSRLVDDSAGFEFDSKWSASTPTGATTGTARRSTQMGASVTMKFNGSSVQIFGGLSSKHGDYSVYLDGVKVTQDRLYHAAFQTDIGEVPLFTASGLKEGPHTVQIVNEGLQGKDSVIDVDYAIVNTTRSDLALPSAVVVDPAPAAAASASSSFSASSSSSSSSSSSVSTGVPPLPTDPASPTSAVPMTNTIPPPSFPTETAGPHLPNSSSANFASGQGGHSSLNAPPVGVIIAIALGGAALVCILLAAIWFVRRRLHTERESEKAWSAPSRHIEMSQRPTSSVFGPPIEYRSEPLSSHPSTLGSAYGSGKKLRQDGLYSAAGSSSGGGQSRGGHRESGSTFIPYERDRRFDPYEDMSEINGPSPYVPRAQMPNSYAPSQYSR